MWEDEVKTLGALMLKFETLTGAKLWAKENCAFNYKPVLIN